MSPKVQSETPGRDASSTALVGQGKVANVYEAERQPSRKKVAVKVLKPEHAHNPYLVEMVNHPAMQLSVTPRWIHVRIYLLLNSSISRDTSRTKSSGRSGRALQTRVQLGMNGVSMGFSRKCSPAFMIFWANNSTACSSE